MKNILSKHTFIAIALLVIGASLSCSEDDERDSSFVNDIADPSNVSLEAIVSTDNSGNVTFAPSGTSVASFEIDFGDGSGLATIAAGESVVHTYIEGMYTVNVTAINSIGKTVSISQEVDVTFIPPENLTIEVEVSDVNVFAITVKPDATNATEYEIFWGEPGNDMPTLIEDGERATYIYNDTGDFEIRVVAKNGGQATIEATTMITILPPGVVLPIDFEDPNLDYDILGFQGADSEIIANEVSGGINTSGTIVRSIKTVGADFFAGTLISLEAPINFSNTQSIQIKTHSEKANIPVRLKLEDESGNQFVELDVNTTVAGEWETLVWDFSGMDTNIDFVRVVIFFEFVPNLEGDGSTYYFDDIELAN